jgi:NAD(P)-dependent dehydrogenase (short-subunit alcohol dehydrogenase family)
VTSDGYGIASYLVDLLKARGCRAEQVATVTANADGIICLEALNNFPNVDQAIHTNYHAFANAKIGAKNILEKNGFFVTVQNTGGDFALSVDCGNNIWTAGLTGLIKTLAIEWPNAHVKAIDIEPKTLTPKQLAQKIADELFLGGNDIEVGLKNDGTRIVLAEKEPSVVQKNLVLKPNSVVVAVGGARGITAKCLIALSKQIKLKLVLLGRTKDQSLPENLRKAKTAEELKSILLEQAKQQYKKVTPKEITIQINNILAVREIQETLFELEANAAEVFYLDVDIQNQAEVNAAICTTKSKWENIDAIVYGAGVLADSLLIHKTTEQFNRVFSTKVIGLKHLLDATKNEPLKFIGLFSSIVGRFGNKGQSDYAMANEVLNKVACQLQLHYGNKCLVKAYNWGPWDGGMVTPEIKAHFSQQNITLLPIDIGVEMFVEEIREQENNAVEVILGDFQKHNQNLNIPDTWTREIMVSQQLFPFLSSHKINGAPVIPACLVVEWFMHAAKGFMPDAQYTICHEMRVLNGMRLEKNDADKKHINIRCQTIEKDAKKLTIAMALFDASGRKCYSATIEKTNITPPPPKKITPCKQTPWSWSETEIYSKRELLFHGKDLQAIKKLPNLADNGGFGELIGSKQLGWNLDNYHYQFDVARYDGVLQLLSLWGYQYFQKLSLPLYIGSFIEYKPLFNYSRLNCEFQSKIEDNFHTISTAKLTTLEGEIVAILKDVKMYIYNDIR